MCENKRFIFREINKFSKGRREPLLKPANYEYFDASSTAVV